MVSSTRSVFTRSKIRPSDSRLVGSSQCTSSNIIRTGLERDSASSCAVSASSVFCRRCCEFSQCASVQILEAALNRSGSHRCPGRHRPHDTLEVQWSEFVKLEQVAHELAGTFSNHDAVRLCNALQACRNVRGFTNNGLFLR